MTRTQLDAARHALNNMQAITSGLQADPEAARDPLIIDLALISLGTYAANLRALMGGGAC